MRILVAADLHLDSAYGSRRWADPDVAAEQQRDVLTQLIDLTVGLRPDALLIAGDLFHMPYLRPETKRHMARQFKRLGETPVLISPGNHDPYTAYKTLKLPGNVRVFANRWASHPVGNGLVWGYGHYDETEPSSVIARLGPLDRRRVNVVLFHGSDLGTEQEEHDRFAAFTRKEMEATGADFFALGHIHWALELHRADGRLLGCYPGAIRGLNSGKKGTNGVLLVNITKTGVTRETYVGTEQGFIPGEVSFARSEQEVAAAVQEGAPPVASSAALDLDEILNRAGFSPNTEQRSAIAHHTGPQLIKAGPGSGKTQVLVMRALHLMLGSAKVDPRNLILCTFTEKAAAQLKDRITSALAAVAPQTDVSDLTVGTIHGICRRILDEFLSKTPLKRGYQVLDEMTQRLFILQHLKKIQPPDFGRLMGKTKIATTSAQWFNKITEEMIDPALLVASGDPFLKGLGEAYSRYVANLREENSVDFAFLQRYVYDLTQRPDVRAALTERFTHFMIDEYQDTNYIQEQLFLALASPAFNICVVGDDDQALYRFRGATVRNLLEFPNHFAESSKPELTEVTLKVNYRSQKAIVEFYRDFMDRQDWAGPKGRRFRFEKAITSERQHDPGYPAVVRIEANSVADEAQRVAAFVQYLQRKNVIHDLNEVAVLLSSVRPEKSGPYMEAFAAAGLPFFAPRARQYFDNPEVQAAVGALVEVLDFHDNARGDFNLADTWAYLDAAVDALYAAAGSGQEQLKKALKGMRDHLFAIPAGRASDYSLLDIFYQLQRYEPFAGYLADETTTRNLAMFSQLLAKFQQYYGSRVLYGDSLDRIRVGLFNSFLHMLIKEGMDEYEDPYDIFPSGHVQIMTIHQAKGLEFPVVIVGSLNSRARTDGALDEALGAFYARSEFEPANRIAEFDFLRKFYVAFSRAQHLLLLPAGSRPNPRIRPIWQELPELAEQDEKAFRRLKYPPRKAERPKPSFSLTSDVLVYDTCPRQYQLLKTMEFQASAGGQMFFGMLVHHTIEDCHRIILEQGQDALQADVVERLFDANYESLRKQGIHPIAREHKDAALRHVTNYLANSPDILKRVRQTEVPVVVDKKEYYLTGIIDVLLGEDGKWELLDFKANRRIEREDDLHLQNYRLQLATYGRAVEEKLGIRPERFSIYWTGEEEKAQAYMPLYISEKDMDAAHGHFDDVARRILDGDFNMTPMRKAKLDKRVCGECDFRWGCNHRTGELPKQPWER